MKTIVWKLPGLALVTLLASSCAGQTTMAEKKSIDSSFMKTMEKKVRVMDSASNPKILESLTADFERIALAEKDQWLPFYYAALGQIKLGTMLANGQSKTKMDERADKGEKMLNKAIELSRETSETWCLKSMLATLRLIADPMSRWQQYGAISSSALAKAEQLDPNNPRVFVLKGEDKFYTPEEYGGDKKLAKEYFEKAIRLFDSFKPETNIHPNWGKNQTLENLKQLK